MKFAAGAAALLLLSCKFVGAQAASPERKVQGNVIASERDPAVRIDLPASVHYVGAHRWTLYNVADCELHVFVEADENKKVQRLYWIQFEAYIPSRPELHYDYSEDATREFAGRTFFVNTSSGEPDRKPKSGSDLEQVQRLIRSAGYSLPDYSINARLVNLWDDDRKELMIIYAENLQPFGITPADLKTGGRAERRWPELERHVEEQAKARIKIEWTGDP